MKTVFIFVIQFQTFYIFIADIEYMVASHYTSKIDDFEDLAKVSSYGFRGEALHSLCSVSGTMEILSKRDVDQLGKTIKFDKNTKIVSESNVAATRGTIIKAFDIFDNLPVRRNYYKKKERKNEDFKKIENFIWSYGLIHPKLRIALFHNKVYIFCDFINFWIEKIPIHNFYSFFETKLCMIGFPSINQ